MIRHHELWAKKKKRGGTSTITGGGPSVVFLKVALSILFVITTITFQSPLEDDLRTQQSWEQQAADVKTSTSTTTTISSSSFSSTSGRVSSTLSMTKWRTIARAECHYLLLSSNTTNNKTIDDPEVLNRKEALERTLLAKMTIDNRNNNESTKTITGSGDGTAAIPIYKRDCWNVFIDLGTNIGDSIGYFIDTAIDVCSPLWWTIDPKLKFSTDFPRLYVNVSTMEVNHRQNVKPNRLLFLLQRLLTAENGRNNPLKSLSQPHDVVGPESFCVYGVEGNPTFTERLIKLQNFIMDDIRPRPVSHVHIFTESVVVATDGPTKLFLDKTSVDHNFWGSSILSSQRDATKTAKEYNGGTPVSVDVMGISLSTLVRSTMHAALQKGGNGVAEVSSTSPEQQEQQDHNDGGGGGSLIIKMDIEGAEYQVLKEVAASDVLCELTKLGTRVVIIVEYHDNKAITDASELENEKVGVIEARRRLMACGVQFEKLPVYWS